jgi:lysophospholipase L1-like esterase
MNGMRRHTTLGVLVALITILPGLALAAQRGGRQRPTFYVALGTSLSVGVQPDAAGVSRPTADGYADQLYAALAPATPGLRLHPLGCPGETSATMLAGGLCHYEAGSQLAEAVRFLRAHRDEVALVTLDIGANDIEPCGSLAGIDQACVAAAFGTVATNLPRILSALAHAAGPGVPVVAMSYYNPFLVAWLLGPAGQELAREAAFALNLFNAMLGGIYTAFRVPVADVAGAFHSGDPLPPPGDPGVPLGALLLCQWTWMCAPPPVGPNIHANADGYGVIAAAFLAVMP